MKLVTTRTVSKRRIARWWHRQRARKGMKKAASSTAHVRGYQGAFVNCTDDDLRALRDALRELQHPYGQTFWRLERFIARLDTEIQRRAS